MLMTSRQDAIRALEDCHHAGVSRVWLVGDDATGEARAYAEDCLRDGSQVFRPAAGKTARPDRREP